MQLVSRLKLLLDEQQNNRSSPNLITTELVISPVCLHGLDLRTLRRMVSPLLELDWKTDWSLLHVVLFVRAKQRRRSQTKPGSKPKQKSPNCQSQLRTREKIIIPATPPILSFWTYYLRFGVQVFTRLSSRQYQNIHCQQRPILPHLILQSISPPNRQHISIPSPCPCPNPDPYLPQNEGNGNSILSASILSCISFFSPSTVLPLGSHSTNQLTTSTHTPGINRSSRCRSTASPTDDSSSRNSHPLTSPSPKVPISHLLPTHRSKRSHRRKLPRLILQSRMGMGMRTAMAQVSMMDVAVRQSVSILVGKEQRQTTSLR